MQTQPQTWWQVLTGWLSKTDKSMPISSPLPETAPAKKPLPFGIKDISIPLEPNFERSIIFTLIQEGGSKIVEHPKDPGGLTKWGIAIKFRPNLTREKLIAMTQEEAIIIYHREYWMPCGCQKMVWPMCQVLFDTAVNLGVGTALGFLSRAVGATESDRARSIITQRVLHYQIKAKKNPSKKIFLRGWMARVAALKKDCGFD